LQPEHSGSIRFVIQALDVLKQSLGQGSLNLDECETLKSVSRKLTFLKSEDPDLVAEKTDLESRVGREGKRVGR